MSLVLLGVLIAMALLIFGKNPAPQIQIHGGPGRPALDLKYRDRGHNWKMIDKLARRAYLRTIEGRVKLVLTCGFLGFFLLLAFTGQSLAGAVQDGNPGRSGQTLDLKSLPVKGSTTVVDCYSQYCPPCMRLAPLLEQLAEKRSDLVIKKVDIQRPEISGHIDWQSPLAKQLGLGSIGIPYFIIFDQNGKQMAQGKEATKRVLGWLQEAGLLK